MNEPRTPQANSPGGSTPGGDFLSRRARHANFVTRVLSRIPTGGSLQGWEWKARHKGILVLLALHVVGLLAFSIYQGSTFLHGALEVMPLAALTLAAAIPSFRRRLRGALASVALVTASAILVHLSGGYIEAHFHFFVVLGIIALYQDWVPFGLAVAYVGIHHGAIATFLPGLVYNHPAAVADPWKWAFIHAAFILSLAVATLTAWSVTETANARTSAVLTSAGDGILGIGRDGAILFANPAAAALVAPRQGGLVGMQVCPLLPDARLDEGFGDDVTPMRESTLRRGDGSTIPVEWNLGPVSGGRQDVAYVLTLRDIRERKKAEEVQAGLAKAVQEALVRERLLVDVLTHDVKNQFAAALPRLELLQLRHPELNEPLGRIAASGHAAVRIIDDAMLYMRLDNESPTDRIPVRDLLEAAAGNMANLATQRRVQLRMEAPGPTEGLVSPLLLRAVENLLSNAIKWSPEGAAVELRASCPDDSVRIEIIDHGRGITPEQRRHLYQRFNRPDDEKVPGHGLGLAIVKRIVDMNGGTIDLADTPGGGATFVVHIPSDPMPAGWASPPDSSATNGTPASTEVRS